MTVTRAFLRHDCSSLSTILDLTVTSIVAFAVRCEGAIPPKIFASGLDTTIAVVSS